MGSQPQGVKPIDNGRKATVSGSEAGRGFIHPPCGSRGGPRWYCAGAKPRLDVEARDSLEAAGFAAFLPIAIVAVRHARKTKLVERSIFPGYLFVRLDLADPSWRYAAHATGIARLFGSSPERPTPLPVGLIEHMLAVGFDRPIVEDLAPVLIKAGAVVRIADGPFAGFDGVCQWDDGTRLRVLASIFGRSTPVELDRDQVEYP